MAQAGCIAVLYGIETGSSRMQEVIGKRLDVSKIEPIVRKSVELGMEVSCSFIIGFPEETKEDLDQTLRLQRQLLGLGATVSSHTLAVLPGTEYFRKHVGDLVYDGRPSPVSHAFLSSKEAGEVAAHPEIFSSFYYVESPAGSRELLRATMEMGMMLDHFRHTLLSIESVCASLVDLPAALRKRLSCYVSSDGTYESEILELLSSAVDKASERDGAVAEVFALERHLYEYRCRTLLKPDSGAGREGLTLNGARTFHFTADIGRILGCDGSTLGGGDYVARPCKKAGFVLHPVSPSKARAFGRLKDGMSRRQAVGAMKAELPQADARKFLANCLKHGVVCFHD
jgi:hypothetical protein